MAQQYKNPVGGQPSSVGSQFRTDHYYKKALIEAAKEQYFGQMADVRSMPKNMGKTIKQYHYLPLLEDANINDQGLDAAGVTGLFKKTIAISVSGEENLYTTKYAVGEGSTSGNATTAAQARAVEILVNELGFTTGTYAAVKTAATTAGVLVDDTRDAVPASGNLYGSSKDVGTIAAKMPQLSENGGRVNRVGFKRKELEGTIFKYGFFSEYTKESLDFDTDDELETHVTREMVMGANEMNEDLLQIDLLNAAGVVRYGGAATSTATISGETGNVSNITYNDLMRLEIDLDNNRCPKQTKLIAGSRMVDTRTIEGARYMFIGSELIPTIKKMTDNFGNQAFISVEKYSSAGNTARGEIGAVGAFRIVVVPEMMHWAGAGATVTNNAGYRTTGNKYDVFPMLVVGDESFTTIGFQTDGKTVKFKIKHVKPESETSYSAHDPYGEKGFMSIKWYYGFMALRPERIALVKTVAEF
jgi:N4-gp56 family major capsid protein